MEIIIALLLFAGMAFVAYRVARKLFRVGAAGTKLAYDHREEIAAGAAVTGRVAGKAAGFVGTMISKGARATMDFAEDSLRERRYREIVLLEDRVDMLVYSLNQIQEPALAASAQAVLGDLQSLADGLMRQRAHLENANALVNQIASSKEMEALHSQATHIDTEIRRLLAQQESLRSHYTGGGQEQSYRSSSRGATEEPLDEVAKAFRVLELDPNSSPEEIKKQYRNLLKIWHSDKAGGDLDLVEIMTRKTQEINGAYDVIKRAKGFK